MQTIHEVATITSKGQITLPKSIRQALGVDFGGKVAFDLRGSQVFVSPVEDVPHEDPAGQLQKLEAAVVRAKIQDPEGFWSNANVKLFNALSQLMLETYCRTAKLCL